MKTITCFAFVVFSLAFASAAKIVCYYQSWATENSGDALVKPTDLDPNLCTHINYAFGSIKSDGGLDAGDEGLYKSFEALKNTNKNLKLILSVGGADDSNSFKGVAGDSNKRKNFVKNARNFVQSHNFDGVDIDWEYPEKGQGGNFVALLQDLKNDFQKNSWIVSVAVGADVDLGDYDVKKISDIVDYISVMTYDMYDTDSKITGQNSPLYASSAESDWEKQNLNLDAAIKQWKSKGANPGKLLPGLAFYGHSFTLKNPNDKGVNAPASIGQPGPILKQKGTWSYFEFCEDKSWNCHWDDQQKVPICLNGNQWLGIDNEQSIKEKVAYIKANGLGGAMVWSIDQDDVHGKCGKKQLLLRTIKNNL